MNILIQNGRLIDPANSLDEIAGLFIEDGIICGIGDNTASISGDYHVLNAGGMVVCPGFIDLHCHLRQPGFEEKETIATGTVAATRGGFTTVCCMPNTQPPIATPETVQQVIDIAWKESKIRVLPVAAVTVGRKGEELADLVALHDAGAIGFSDDGSPVANTDIMRRALEAGKSLNVPIIDHCEDLDLAHGGLVHDGAVASKMGYRGIPSAAEERMVERDIELAGQTGGWIHIAHVSSYGSVELIRRARRDGIRITAEVTPHHLTLTEQAVLEGGTAAKVNPPLRTEADRQGLIAGLREGVIDIIATDHAPHTAADKDCAFQEAAFGISGFETALGCLMALVRAGDLDIYTLVSRLTGDPARILNNKSIGTMKVGSPAEITIFDPNAEWKVDTVGFASKGENNPFKGKTLIGKIMYTLRSGEIIYQAD